MERVFSRVATLDRGAVLGYVVIHTRQRDMAYDGLIASLWEKMNKAPLTARWCRPLCKNIGML